MDRRIAAILAADIVGFSRLVEQDEASVIARQKQHMDELIQPAIEAARGRVVKLTGDGLLAEFPSVVDTVRCAVGIQKEMTAREQDQPPDRRIQYRIAVNLGDVIFEEGDVYGDGVNIAARLEALAEPGGVVVSGEAYDHLKTKAGVGFRSLGSQQLTEVSRWTGSSESSRPASRASFLALLTQGRTNFAWISQTSMPRSRNRRPQ